jgi:hypothetical protein
LPTHLIAAGATPVKHDAPRPVCPFSHLLFFLFVEGGEENNIRK